MVMSARACLVVLFLVGQGYWGLSLAKEREEGGKEEVVSTLSKEQVQEFSAFVQAKSLRREEFLVCTRLIREKQGELKGFVDELAKEFGMSSAKAYTFEKATRSLFELSTNRVDKAGKPERTLHRQIKTDSEAQYVSRLMVARGLTEQQLQVLVQLREEKAKEFGLLDNKLRQAFKLEPKVSYRLDEKTGRVFRLPVPESRDDDLASVQAATNRAAAASGAKESAKKGK